MERIAIEENFKLSEMKNVEKLDELKEYINKVNDIYFTNFSQSRNDLLKTNIMETIKIIDNSLQNSNILNKNELAFLYFTKSHCLDKLPEYSKQAEESASKLLKLNPFNADNYNCIAHILWKKGDIDGATNYYLKALEQNEKNKTALRNYSMIIRSHKENQSQTERIENCKKSIEFAKKAINLDLKDSESWYVNANAYLNSAFISDKQYEDLKYALNSYNFSEKYHKEYRNPDLFYNRGIVHAYLENYDIAYNDFIKAHEIDQNLKADTLAENIIQTLTYACKLVKNQCTIKPKRLSQILNSIPTNVKDNISYSLGQIDKLKLGENPYKLISAKGIQVIKNIFEVPLSIICVDHNGSFFCLSFYNVSKNFLDQIHLSTASIILLDPIFKKISLEVNLKKYEYPSIQITNLTKLLVDGRYCSNFASQSLMNSKFFN